MALSSKRPILEPLQAVRGLAALLITAKHALYEVEVVSSQGFQSPSYGQYILAIDVFFVLSGFIMIYTCGAKIGLKAAKDFMLRRIIRIMPLYWFYTFLLLAVALIIPHVLDNAVFEWRGFLKSLFFIPYINPANDLQPFLAVGWSLNYEMYFYAIFALCMLLPGMKMLAAMTTYYLGTVILGPMLLPSGVTETFYTNPIVLEFLAGAWIGMAFIKNIRLPEKFKIPCVAIAALVTLPVFNPELYTALTGFEYSRMLAAIIILACISLPRGMEYVQMPRFFNLTGDSSYTIYLSHAFFIGAVTQLVLLTNIEPWIPSWILFAIVMIFCIFGGWIFYWLFELPMVKGIKDYLRSKRDIDKTELES